MAVVGRVELLRTTDGQPSLLGEGCEVLRDRRQGVLIEPMGVASASRLRSVVSTAGFDVPRANGPTAVCSTWKPALSPSM